MATDRSTKSRALQKKAAETVMLAHKYVPGKHLAAKDAKKSIHGWMIYEKIDGVRAILKDGKLLSRTAHEFSVPPEFLEQLMAVFGNLELDGELVHPDGFQKTVSVVRDQTKKNTIEYWKNVKYVIFDYMSDVAPFESRIKVLNSIASGRKLKYASILPSLGIVSKEKDIQTHLKKVIKAGGEGLILRNPNAIYEFGRSHNLLKVKEFQDIEALVIDSEKGDGKHADRMGTLTCQMKNGKIFRVGTGFSDEEREKPPKIGDVITVRYFELTDDGVPRFPVFVAVRDYE